MIKNKQRTSGCGGMMNGVRKEINGIMWEGPVNDCTAILKGIASQNKNRQSLLG